MYLGGGFVGLRQTLDGTGFALDRAGVFFLDLGAVSVLGIARLGFRIPPHPLHDADDLVDLASDAVIGGSAAACVPAAPAGTPRRADRFRLPRSRSGLHWDIPAYWS